MKDGIISFGHMAATMKLCPEAINDQEFRFFQSLKEMPANPPPLYFGQELYVPDVDHVRMVFQFQIQIIQL